MTTLVQDQAPAGAIAGSRREPLVGPLSQLRAGRAGVIVALRLDPGVRLTETSPLRIGARVEVLEAVTPASRHVRIGFREYSIPAEIGQAILVDCSGELAPESLAAGTGADTCYEVVLNRLSRGVFKLLIVRRDTGAVVHGEILERSVAAKAARDALRAEAASMSAEAFRLRHKLP
jgi:hypothetical protein